MTRLVSRMYADDVASRFNWLYESNPHGAALTWIAIEKESGAAAACTSVFPRRVVVDGRERTGSIGGDCYVDPNFRRLGLATALHRVSLASMRERGVEFMYGPPNPSNLGALLKAGSHLVAGFKRFVRPLTGRAVYRPSLGHTASRLRSRLAELPVLVLDRLTRAEVSGVTLQASEEFGSDHDRLFARASRGRGVVGSRDAAYLEWRYTESPLRVQQPFDVRRRGLLEGIVVVEVSGEHAAVIDIFAPNDAVVLDAALQLLHDMAQGMGCSSLEISAMPEPFLVSRLKRLGFIGRSERGFQVFLAEDDPQRATLLDPDAWFFTAGDQDMDTFFSDSPD